MNIQQQHFLASYFLLMCLLACLRYCSYVAHVNLRFTTVLLTKPSRCCDFSCPPPTRVYNRALPQTPLSRLTEMTALGSPAFQSSLGSRRLSLSSLLITNPAVACQLSATERYQSLKLLSCGRLLPYDLPRQPSGKSTHLSCGFHIIQIGPHPPPSINT